jgi:hypothetical protein
MRDSASMLVPGSPTRQWGTGSTTSSTIARGAWASRSYVSGIAPAREFSIGSTPHAAWLLVTARITSAADLQGCSPASGYSREAASAA